MNFENELNCKRWERLRGAVLVRDQFMDQIKKRYGKRVGADTVHHIFPREYFPEYAFSEWNLISVSKQTHNTLHDRETHKLTAEGWNLLVKTARKNGIEVDENLREVIVAVRKRR